MGERLKFELKNHHTVAHIFAHTRRDDLADSCSGSWSRDLTYSSELTNTDYQRLVLVMQSFFMYTTGNSRCLDSQATHYLLHYCLYVTASDIVIGPGRACIRVRVISSIFPPDTMS